MKFSAAIAAFLAPVIFLSYAIIMTGSTPSEHMPDARQTAPASKATLLDDQIRKYIDQNPEVILQSIQRMQARQELETKRRAEAAVKTKMPELTNDPDAPIAGNPAGNVTIVEFFDYRCGYCKRVFPSIMKVLKEDPNIRYVFKEFPILGPESVVAAKAALAVWRIDKTKYQDFHSDLMKMRGSPTEAKLLAVASARGMDPTALKAAMADPALQTILEKNYRLAQSLNINGTPAFVIGEKLVPGAIDIETMKRMIAEARRG